MEVRGLCAGNGDDCRPPLLLRAMVSSGDPAHARRTADIWARAQLPDQARTWRSGLMMNCLKRELEHTMGHQLILRIGMQAALPEHINETIAGYLAPSTVLVRSSAEATIKWTLIDADRRHVLTLQGPIRDAGLPQPAVDVATALYGMEDLLYVGTSAGALMAHQLDGTSGCRPLSVALMRIPILAITQACSCVVVGLKNGTLWTCSRQLRQLRQLAIPRQGRDDIGHGRIICMAALPSPRMEQVAVGTQWGGICVVDTTRMLVHWMSGTTPVGPVTAMTTTEPTWPGARGRAGPLLHASCGSRITTIAVEDMTALVVTHVHSPVMAMLPTPDRGLMAGTAACPTGGVRLWKEHELGGSHHSPWSTLGLPQVNAPEPRADRLPLRGTLLGGGTVHAMARYGEAAYVAMDTGLVVIWEGRASLLCEWRDSEEASRALTVLPWSRGEK